MLGLLMLDNTTAGTSAWDGLLDDADCFDFIVEPLGSSQAQTFTTTEIFASDAAEPVLTSEPIEPSVKSVTAAAKFQPTTQAGLSSVLSQALSRNRAVPA